MIVASKIFDDESYENGDFWKLCPFYSRQDINKMERWFLKILGYDLSIKGSEYASVYFRLRTLGARDSKNANLGITP